MSGVKGETQIGAAGDPGIDPNNPAALVEEWSPAIAWRNGSARLYPHVVGRCIQKLPIQTGKVVRSMNGADDAGRRCEPEAARMANGQHARPGAGIVSRI